MKQAGALAASFAGLWTTFAPALALPQDDEQTSPTLTVVASDPDGLPVEGAAFRVEFPDREPAALTTGEIGTAEVVLDDAAGTVSLRLADDRFWTPDGARVAYAGAEFFSLYPTDVSRMTREQRIAYATALARALPQHFAEEAASLDDAERLAAHRVAALMRPAIALEDRQAGGLTIEQAAQESRLMEGAIGVRVLDHLGKPAEGVLVSMLSFDLQAGAARLASFERTNTQGDAVFDSLPLGSWYRATATSPAGQPFSSGIAELSPADSLRTLEPIVMREGGFVARGFLLRSEDLPAAGAMIFATPRPNGPTFRTTAGPFGYFTLPLPDNGGESVTLTIRHALEGSLIEERVRVSPEDGEILLLLDRLVAREQADDVSRETSY
ncbi:MAG: hypothetical protein RLY93_13810 [Sumerlaeia bacterium]